MIKVVATYRNQKFVSLLSKGHANSAEKGKDLVCAAVSAILLTGANAFQREEDFDVEVDEGYFSLKAKRQLNDHDEIAIETIVKQIERLAETHKEFVQLERKDQQ